MTLGPAKTSIEIQSYSTEGLLLAVYKKLEDNSKHPRYAQHGEA